MANWIGNVIQGLIQKQIYVHVNLLKLIVIWPLFKVSTGHAKKQPNDNLKRFTCTYICFCIYQSLYDITNPIGRNLISVPVLTNGLGRNLISVLCFTYPLGRRLISALVLTSHLKCQIILLILLCLATPFFNGPRLFLFSISLIFAGSIHCRDMNAHKDEDRNEILHNE